MEKLYASSHDSPSLPEPSPLHKRTRASAVVMVECYSVGSSCHIEQLYTAVKQLFSLSFSSEEVGFGEEANDALPSRRGGPPRRPRLKSEEKSQRKTRSAEQGERQEEGGRSSDWPLSLA